MSLLQREAPHPVQVLLLGGVREVRVQKLYETPRALRSARYLSGVRVTSHLDARTLPAPFLWPRGLHPPVRRDDVRGDVDGRHHAGDDDRDDGDLQHEEHAWRGTPSVGAAIGM